MDPKFQTSFIPKKPIAQSAGIKAPHTTNFFSLITIIIFVTVLAIAGAVWGYKSYLESSNAKLKTQLSASLKQFEPSLIAELSRLDSRIESTKTLLNQHIALSSFFDFLARVTIPSIRFSSFKYTLGAQKVVITMSGQAKSFAAVALQSGEMLKPQNLNYIRNPLFSNLNVDLNGNVLFDFSGSVDLSQISYRTFINNQATLQNTTVQDTTVAPPAQNTTGTTSATVGTSTVIIQ